MLDMGFIRDIRKIFKFLPAKRQNLLFSATFSGDIRNLANNLLDNPTEIQVASRNQPAERISQVVLPVDKGRKRELLSHRIGKDNMQQVIEAFPAGPNPPICSYDFGVGTASTGS